MARVRLNTLSDAELEKAVRDFDALYGEMEEALWCLSEHCREPLIKQESSPVVETLVWTIKSWWGVSGVVGATKMAMADAIVTLEWSEDVFEPVDVLPDAQDLAVQAVTTVVEATRAALGIRRREYSLASKVLHWLLPWRIPAYDSYVRRSLGVPTGWEGPQAYPRVARELLDGARALKPRAPDWMGPLEPHSRLRALDKCAWWLGGGDAGTAARVPNPWQVVDSLGLDRC